MSLHCASHNHSESSDWRNRPWTGSQLSWWSRGWWLALHPAVCPSSSRAPDSGSRRGDTGGTSPAMRRPSAARLQQTFTSNICILHQKLLIEVFGEWVRKLKGERRYLWDRCCGRIWRSNAGGVGSCRDSGPVCPASPLTFQIPSDKTSNLLEKSDLQQENFTFIQSHVQPWSKLFWYLLS